MHLHSQEETEEQQLEVCVLNRILGRKDIGKKTKEIYLKNSGLLLIIMHQYRSAIVRNILS